MPSGGLKIVSEANLGRLMTSNNRRREEEKYKEVVVCIDHSASTTTPTTIRHDDSIEHILSDSTNIFRSSASGTSSSLVNGGSSLGHGGSSPQEQRTFYNMDSKSWQGGFATVVSPAEEVGREQPPSPIFVAAETTPSAAAVGRNRGGGRRPTVKVCIFFHLQFRA